jgi:hypothetical protein
MMVGATKDACGLQYAERGQKDDEAQNHVLGMFDGETAQSK